jgi:transposase-like protein
MPMVKEWQNRPLQKVYAVVFLDAIHFKVKQDGQIVNKAAVTYPEAETSVSDRHS